MNFVFTGRVTKLYPINSGISKTNKEWKNQQFVVEEEGVQYPQSCAFVAFGDDKIAQVELLNIGSLVEVHFNIKANASEKGHFNNINAWKIVRLDAKNTASYTPQAQGGVNDNDTLAPDGEGGELPF